MDFRLELDGVLKSWAVPKAIPQKAGIRRLVVHVEDRPVDYINFQGIIPKGNYGAGKVKIWDKGKFELLERNGRAIKFILSGKKLKGQYILFKFRNKNLPSAEPCFQLGRRLYSENKNRLISKTI